MRLLKTFYTASDNKPEKKCNKWIKDNNVKVISITVSSDDVYILYESNELIKNKQRDREKYKIKYEKSKEKNEKLINIIKEHQKGGLMLDVDIGKLSLNDEFGKLSIDDSVKEKND